MASGKLMVGSIVMIEDSINLNQLVDVTSTASSSGDTLVFKDSTIDSNFTTGWHSTPLETNDLSDVNTSVTGQNSVLSYNVDIQDASYGGTGWYPKNISALFTTLDSTISTIVGLSTARIRAEKGMPSRSDMILFTAAEASIGGPTVSISSCGDNNILEKKEPTEGSFSFVQTVNKGEKIDITLPVGTVLRSPKGIYGFSGPLPTPLGSSSFALTASQFYVSSSATLNVVSLGTEVTVSLFSGDQSTLLSGPTTIAAYQTGSFSCPTVGEYFVNSTGPIVACVNEANSNIRPLVPMATELITRNSGCLVSAFRSSTNVTWYRRNGTTGSVVVSPGTAVALGAGANVALGDNGWVRVVADKPISTFSSTDSIGTQSISGYPVSQLAQLFCNPSFIDSSTSYAQSGVAIGSPYEGLATVYTSAGVVLDTFTYVRSVAVSSSVDQQFPAGGRWKPSDVSASTTWEGGWIETSTPAVCIMNSSGDTTWSSSGQEFFVIGTTPDEIEADIKKVDGITRCRTIDVSGGVSWVVC